jgi:hypothetical protein
MRTLLLTSFFPISVFGQIFSFGGVVGTPLTDVTQTTTIAGINYLRNSTLFTIGPSLQVNLPAGFRIEIDALYRPVAYQIATTFLVGTETNNVSAAQFNFPVLLQYHIGKYPLIKPYAEGGFSFATLSDLQHAAGTIVKTNNAGLVLGFGADIKVPFIRLSPEIRYTRQFLSDFLQISQLNQAEVLLGIRF